MANINDGVYSDKGKLVRIRGGFLVFPNKKKSVQQPVRMYLTDFWFAQLASAITRKGGFRGIRRPSTLTDHKLRTHSTFSLKKEGTTQACSHAIADQALPLHGQESQSTVS
ncbi:MAG: hypothetical protein V1668_00285 [Patescibacteria group bacterium]